MKPLFSDSTIMAVGISLLTAMSISAQTTNSIPNNIFLTDDGRLFWYQHGNRLVDMRKIMDAGMSRECSPADNDPSGNWGQQTNGFQLSLRFEKQVFTNGEDVLATMLIRNITTNAMVYSRPTYIVASKGANQLKQRDDRHGEEMTVSPQATVFPQTQHKFLEHLDKKFDLSENGVYYVQAVCRKPEVSSQIVSIVITNAPQ